MYIAIGVAVFLAALYLFFVFPAPAGKAAKEKFAGRSYAHRGLHDIEAGVPENSLAAFRAAVDGGYGSELDVQLTADKEMVVFHDLDLKRACGVDKKVRDLKYSELKELKLFGTDETIPLFSEVLEAVGGRQPLIVELKSDNDRLWCDECCRIAYAHLKDYRGDYCIESFDPSMVRWFSIYSPKTVRGQLVMGAKSYGKSVPALDRFLVSRLMTNVLNRPHFIAFKYDEKGLSLKIVRALGAMSVMWTVRDPKIQQVLETKEDGIIFEGYRPDARF